ncbi:hypothetical protein FWK35_00006450, partial [Aphis craccivora]
LSSFITIVTKNLVLNFQLLATYTKKFYELYLQNEFLSIFELQMLIKKNCAYVFL